MVGVEELCPPLDSFRIGEIRKDSGTGPHLVLSRRERDEAWRVHGYLADNRFRGVVFRDENALRQALVIRWIGARRLRRTDSRIDDVHVVLAFDFHLANQFGQTVKCLVVVGEVEMRVHGIDIGPLDVDWEVSVVHSLP